MYYKTLFVNRTLEIVLIEFKNINDLLVYIREKDELDIVFINEHICSIVGEDIIENMRGEKNVVLFTWAPLFVNEMEHKRLYHILNNIYGMNKLNKIEAVNNKGSQKNFIEKNDTGVYKINYDDVIFIETYKQNTLIHTHEKDILSYKRMKTHEYNLSDNFSRSHRSYIVNLAYVKSIEGLDIEIGRAHV